MVPPLRARHHRQLQFFRLLGCRHHPAHAHRIGAERLFREDVLLRFHRRHEVFRPVARRRRQQHHVDVRSQHFLVSVEPDKVMVRIHLHLLRHARVFGPVNLSQRLLQAVFENIAHRH